MATIEKCAEAPSVLHQCGRAIPIPSRVVLCCLGLCFLFTAAVAQQNPPPKIIALRASRMLDVNSGSMVHDAVILIRMKRLRPPGLP